jgi:hypothetical protein
MSVIPKKAGSAAAQVTTGVCADCKKAKACIKCCGTELCLTHAYCTNHCQHPSLWKVIDKTEYANTKEAVQKARASIISALEAELAHLETLRAKEQDEANEALAQAAAAAVQDLPAAKRRRTTPHEEASSQSQSDPSKPTFSSVRQTLMETARRQAAAEARQEEYAARRRSEEEAASASSAQKRKPEAWEIAAGLAVATDGGDDMDIISGGNDMEGVEGVEGAASIFVPSASTAASAAAAKVAEDGEITDGEGGADTSSFVRRETHISSVWRVRAPASSPSASPSPSASASASAASAAVASPVAASPPAATTPTASIVAADPLSGASVRASVLSALIRSLRDGSAADAASNRAHAEAYQRAIASGAEPTLAARMARETAEAHVVRPAVVNAFGSRVEQALFEAYPAAAASTAGGSGSGGGGAEEASDAPSQQNVSAEYRQRARALIAALKDPRNYALRDRLLGGDLAPLRLVQLDSSELVPSEVREAKQAMRMDAQRDGQLTDAFMAASDVPCKSCGSMKEVEYHYISGVRDIRKAEIWGSGDDDVKVQYRCKSCGASWIGLG